jgi:LmbE family N-acetylglucosaminyl deacetylase
MIRSLEDIKQLGTILGIWAHPDDEAFSMGGIMAAAVQNDQTVIIVTATRGELGVQDEARWPATRLAEIRTKELEEAYKILGVKYHHWLDYADGECEDVDEAEAVERITEYITQYNPDTILTFGPDGMTGHHDHQTVSKWANMVAKKVHSRAIVYHAINTHEQYENMIEADKQFNIFFNIEKPPVCKAGDCAIHFELTTELFTKKLEALKAMESQTEGMLTVFGKTLHLSLGTEAFVRSRI